MRLLALAATGFYGCNSKQLQRALERTMQKITTNKWQLSTPSLNIDTGLNYASHRVGTWMAAASKRCNQRASRANLATIALQLWVWYVGNNFLAGSLVIKESKSQWIRQQASNYVFAHMQFLLVFAQRYLICANHILTLARALLTQISHVL